MKTESHKRPECQKKASAQKLKLQKSPKSKSPKSQRTERMERTKTKLRKYQKAKDPKGKGLVVFLAVYISVIVIARHATGYVIVIINHCQVTENRCIIYLPAVTSFLRAYIGSMLGFHADNLGLDYTTKSFQGVRRAIMLLCDDSVFLVKQSEAKICRGNK
jgi:hypothetical protein